MATICNTSHKILNDMLKLQAHVPKMRQPKKLHGVANVENLTSLVAGSS